MTRLLRLTVVWMLLLAACSFDEREPATGARTQPVAPAAPVQAERAIAGRLLYVRKGQIWLHTGTDARPVKLPGTVRDPAWSPDGRQVAFVVRDESYSDLYLLDARTGESTQVTYNGDTAAQPRTNEYVHQLVWAAKPTWSPDGAEIIYLSQVRPPTGEGEQPPLYEFPLALYRYSTELIGTRQPTNADLMEIGQEGYDVVSPAWSPNEGRYLAYVRTARSEEPRQIMLYDFTTEQAQPYSGIPENAYDPAWSPDGRMLAFAVPQNGATDIWVIGAPDQVGTAQRLTNTGRARAPVWSPAGSSIAFLNVGDTGTDLYLMDVREENGRLAAGEAAVVARGADIDATAGMSWTR